MGTGLPWAKAEQVSWLEKHLLLHSGEWKGNKQGDHLSGKEPAGQCRRGRRHGFDLWVGKIPWSGKWSTHSSILAWRIPWTGSLVGYSPQGCEQSDLAETHVHTHAEASLASSGSLWTCLCGSFEPLDPPSHRGQLGSHRIGTLTWVPALCAHPDKKAPAPRWQLKATIY